MAFVQLWREVFLHFPTPESDTKLQTDFEHIVYQIHMLHTGIIKKHLHKLMCNCLIVFVARGRFFTLLRKAQKVRLRNFLSSRKYSGQNGAFDFSFYLVKVATPWLSAHVTGLDSVIFLPQPNKTDVMVLIYGVGPWFRTPLLRTAQ